METFNEFDQQGNVPGRNFSDIINHAFQNYFKIIGWSILSVIILMVLSFAFSMIIGPIVGYNPLESQSEMQDIMQDGSMGGNPLEVMLNIPGYKESLGLSYLFGLLLYPLYAGFVYMMHKANTGRSVNFSDIFAGFRHNTVQLIIFGFISGIVFFIAAMLCVVPVFFVIPLFYAGIPFIMFENNTAIEAIKNSFNLAKQIYGTVLGVSFIAFIITVAGVLLCGIGLLATIPFFYAAMYSVYVAYKGLPRTISNNP